MSFAIEKIERYGLLKSGFRNIRSRIDGISAEFDLIPEVSVPVGDDDPGIAGLPHPLVANLMRGASRLIEGEAALRITFSYLMAVAVDTDIDVDLFGGCMQVGAPRRRSMDLVPTIRCSKFAALHGKRSCQTGGEGMIH